MKRLSKETLYEMIRTQMAEVEVGAADTGKEIIELSSLIKAMMEAGLDLDVAESLYDELVGQLVNVHGIDRSIVAERSLSKAAPARQGRMSSKGKVVDLSAVKIDDGDVAEVKQALDSLLRPHGLTVSFDSAPPAAAEPEKEDKIIFGINSKDNPDSLLNVLGRKTDLTPDQIKLILRAVTATSTEIVLENSLVGARSEMDRVVSGDRTAALMKFIKDMNLGSDSMAKVMGALNLWGRMNTVRYEKPATAAPAAPAAQKPAPPADKPAKKQRPAVDYDGTPVARPSARPEDVTLNVPTAAAKKTKKKAKKKQKKGVDYDGTPAAAAPAPEDLSLSFPGDEPSQEPEASAAPAEKDLAPKQDAPTEPTPATDDTKLKVGPDNSVEVDGKTKYIRSKKDHEGKAVVVGDDGKVKIGGKGRSMKLYASPAPSKRAAPKTPEAPPAEKPEAPEETAPTEEPAVEEPAVEEPAAEESAADEELPSYPTTASGAPKPPSLFTPEEKAQSKIGWAKKQKAPKTPEATEPEEEEEEEEEEESQPYDGKEVAKALERANKSNALKDNLVDGEGPDAKDYYLNGTLGLRMNTKRKNANKKKKPMTASDAKSEMMDVVDAFRSSKKTQKKQAFASYMRGLSGFIRQQAKDAQGIARPDGVDMNNPMSESDKKDSLNESFMLRWKQLAGIL